MKIQCPHCDKFIDLVVKNPKIDTDEATKEQDIIPELVTRDLYINTRGLNLRSDPKIKENNIIKTLKYGDKVVVLEEQEKWYKVRFNDNEGWVSSFYLSETIEKPSEDSNLVAETISNILPVFKKSQPNLANDQNTIKLRKIIKDEFTGGVHGWDLQCTEYVHYKVQQMGIDIQWPSDRPRHGGKWASIIDRNKLYKVFDTPKAGCAMSFTGGLKDLNIGHVAFVEEVYKDESIKISEANWPPPGKYFERVLSKAEWKDKFKGRFIDFT